MENKINFINYPRPTFHRYLMVNELPLNDESYKKFKKTSNNTKNQYRQKTRNDYYKFLNFIIDIFDDITPDEWINLRLINDKEPPKETINHFLKEQDKKNKKRYSSQLENNIYYKIFYLNLNSLEESKKRYKKLTKNSKKIDKKIDLFIREFL
jgi:hypothetical protein